MRLIDADNMKTLHEIQMANFNSIEGIQEWIDRQPTAYDVDEVIRQLDEYITKIVGRKSALYQTIIGIVRKGGVEYMAELINKKDAIAIVKSIPCATAEEEFTKSTAEGCIKRLPTTTESEIRAKAIDEFAEKLCDAFSEKYGEVTVNGIKFDVLTLDGATEITWEVAEQLKEE